MRALNLTLLTDLYEFDHDAGIFQKSHGPDRGLRRFFTEKIPVTGDTLLQPVWIRSLSMYVIFTLLLMISTISAL